MKKPEKGEEWLIQRKIDGNLSATEEEEFSELMNKSSKARSFYQRLVNLHHAMENDAESIPSVDFSPGIMSRLKPKRSILAPVKTKQFHLGSPRKLLTYAAVLLTGLLIGTAITYRSTGPAERPSPATLSGTMAGMGVFEGYYSKDGTEIKITKAEQENFRLLTFALSTADPVEVTINPGKPDTEQVSLLFSDGLFQFAGDRDDKLLYHCTGQHIFQISDAGLSKSLRVTFSRNNEIFYELNPK